MACKRSAVRSRLPPPNIADRPTEKLRIPGLFLFVRSAERRFVSFLLVLGGSRASPLAPLTAAARPLSGIHPSMQLDRWAIVALQPIAERLKQGALRAMQAEQMLPIEKLV